jgi:hypothetical protein
MKYLIPLIFCLFTPSLAAQEINAPGGLWFWYQEKTITVTGGTPYETCRLDWEDGMGQGAWEEKTYDANGDCTFTVTLPTWDIIFFSIDPDDWEDDVARAILPF